MKLVTVIGIHRSHSRSGRVHFCLLCFDSVSPITGSPCHRSKVHTETVRNNGSDFIHKIRVRKKSNLSYIDPSTYNALPGYNIPRSCVSYNPLANAIYIIGQTSMCIIYDITGDQWSTCAHMNVANRWYAGCAIDSSSMNWFVFGGYSGQSAAYLNSIEQFNVSANTWTTLTTTLNEPKEQHSCILFETYDHQIYCAGGSTSSSQISTIEIFDPLTLTIDSTTYQLNVARFLVRLSLSGRCLLFLGGEADGHYSNLIEYICASTSSSPTAGINIIFFSPHIHTLCFVCLYLLFLQKCHRLIRQQIQHLTQQCHRLIRL